MFSYPLLLFPDDVFEFVHHEFYCLKQLMALSSNVGGMAPSKIDVRLYRVPMFIPGDGNMQIDDVVIRNEILSSFLSINSFVASVRS